MANNTSSVQLIQGAVQQYAWGKVGKSSKVALLCANADLSFSLKDDEPYAELWMGAHPKAPSKLIGGDKNLLDFVKEYPGVLGEKVVSQFGVLPFLFKVLSVAKSLSIQAHPDKALAEKLHVERPEVYRDSNHKPEMAIALTEFEALCGFRPVKEIVQFLEAVPELEAVVGKVTADRLKAKCLNGVSDVASSLKECFSNVILSEKHIREECLNTLVQRIEKMKEDNLNLEPVHGELLLRVHSQFPGDVGCFVIYFLNHILLSSGEAIFLGANVPHAYLSGDCIECMACSDNVVRAGLTPKLVDASTLCDMLEYLPTPAEDRKFQPKSSDYPFELVYDPPVKDFAVICIRVPSDHEKYAVKQHDSASILLCISGTASVAGIAGELKPGVVAFIPANVLMEIFPQGSEILLYRATCIL
ncbi:unnamed protein product [Clavelina lepadiformis]|uniref:Mannose-6-phosphate isomerase n=1 Tax=Clavelina lepadiformis TaxID=159417 RepID=A0ABP0H405_CLALP